jgi:diguanylate cyclase (GGDEF)-like protein/putative nucleotidyltransferase with HDIG domain
MGLVTSLFAQGSLYPYLVVGLLLGLLLTYFRHQHIELDNKNAELRWFSEMHVYGQTLAETEDPKKMVDLTERRLATMFDGLSSYIVVQTTGSDAMRHEQVRGLSALTVERLSREPLRSYLASCGERWGSLVVFPNLARPSVEEVWQRDPLFHELRLLCLREGLRTLLLVGLQVLENPYGVLMLGSRKARAFSRNELCLLLAMGSQLSVAVENWSLHRAEERHNHERWTLHRIGESLRSTYDFDSQVGLLRRELKSVLTTTNFSLALQDWPGGPLETVVPFERPAGAVVLEAAGTGALADFVCQSRRPLRLSHELPVAVRELGIDFRDPHLRSWCGVPMRFSDGALGVLAAADFERENAVNEEEFELIQVLADEAVSAFESTRIFQQQQRRSRDLERVNELSQEAARENNPQELLWNICGKVRSRFERDFVRIEVADPETRELIVEAEAGYGADLLARRAPYDEGLSGAAAVSREPVLANVVREDRRYVALCPSVRSSLSLPLRYRDGLLLGVLSLESLREHSFSHQDVLTLQLLADQLAIHFHNARAYQAALDQAITDGLTGLKTHRFFMEALERECSQSLRTGRPLSVLMMDLDGFKRVNDQGGHLEGDRVLAQVARLLESRSRQSNVVARYGGDEFAVIASDSNIDEAETLAERLRSAIESDNFLRAHGVTASIGIASLPDHGQSAEDILRFADSGMYLAKNRDGNRTMMASLSFGTGDTEADQQLLGAYLEVAMKRMMPAGASALSQYGYNFEQRKPLVATMTALAYAIEARDPYTKRHSRTVSRWACRIAQQMGLADAEIEQIRLAAVLHDIGKFHVPESILCKETVLTAEEYETAKSHACWGAKILEPLKEKSIEGMVRHHHEYFGGKGYPDGLKGAEIPLGARIIAVVDAFDAIIHDRLYRKARPVDEALAELRRCRGTQFDPLVVDVLVELVKTGGGAETAESIESLVI